MGSVTVSRERKTMTRVLALWLLLVSGSTAFGQVLYVNGSLNPVATSLNGTPAPAGSNWSECQNDTGNTTTSNGTLGYGCGTLQGGSGTFHMSDDFTVPAGPSWNVSGLGFYGYQTGASSTVSPFTGVVVRILSDNPMTNPSAPVDYHQPPGQPVILQHLPHL